MPELIGLLTEAGPLAAFAVWMAIQNKQAGVKHDELVEKFQAQIRELDEKRETDEEKLRDRYDAVLRQYESERKEMLERIAESIQTGLGEMRQHYAAIAAREDHQ